MHEEFSPRNLSPEEARILADSEKPLRDAARDSKKVEEEARSLNEFHLEQDMDAFAGDPDYDPAENFEPVTTEYAKEALDARAEAHSDKELRKILDEK